jgi:hypothetical protein
MSGPVADATTTPGSFYAIAEALLFGRSSVVTVAAAAGDMITFTPSAPTALPNANRIAATISIPSSMRGSLDKGYLFITSGGLVVDCYDVDSLVAYGGGSYTISNLPGGTSAVPLSGAFYGVNVLGWGGGGIASGSRLNIDLTTGNGSAAITLAK